MKGGRRRGREESSEQKREMKGERGKDIKGRSKTLLYCLDSMHFLPLLCRSLHRDSLPGQPCPARIPHLTH